ncbi:hypothetical protein [Flavobacterium sp. LB1P71]|uniref:hypothetical protein n=1 Tax=unclassified Flavobacterium TaxID=196869 RepID=UPI003AAB20BF
MKILKPLILSSFLFFISCNKSMKFNKIEWQKSEDGFYIHREEMIDDLMKNHHLETLNYNEIIKLLGNPENYSDEEAGIIYYNIITDYGWDIDPVFVQTLKIKTNNTSKINTIKLEEYKK